MRAALALCCTLGVDSAFLQVLGSPVCSFLEIHASIQLLAYSCFALLCRFLLYSRVSPIPLFLDVLPIHFTTEHGVAVPARCSRADLTRGSVVRCVPHWRSYAWIRTECYSLAILRVDP